MRSLIHTIRCSPISICSSPFPFSFLATRLIKSCCRDACPTRATENYYNSSAPTPIPTLTTEPPGLAPKTQQGNARLQLTDKYHSISLPLRHTGLEPMTYKACHKHGVSHRNTFVPSCRLVGILRSLNLRNHELEGEGDVLIISSAGLGPSTTHLFSQCLAFLR